MHDLGCGVPRDPDNIPASRLALALAAGPMEGAALLRAFGGDAEAVHRAAPRELSAVLGEGAARRVHAAFREVQPDEELNRMRAHGIACILPGDPDWPPLLAAIEGAPLALWVRGRLMPEDRFAVAIVGSRACTGYGLEQADRFGGWLAEQGFTIVSGGARGIDAAAHRAAIRHGGRTIAVLAGGLGVPYPPEHAPLFDAIVEAGGCVCSEMPTLHPSAAGLFPRRNRIISGLSLGTLLIEARMRSGALITGRIAAEEHGREVMAVPGRVDAPASAGCHRAIREGWAALVDSLEAVTSQLRCTPMLVAATIRHTAAPDQAPAGRAGEVLRAIRSLGRPDVDAVAAHCGLGAAEVLAAITMLELSGVRIREAGATP
jgi:DNA processing protein